MTTSTHSHKAWTDKGGHVIKALSKWKSIDIQRINPGEPDYQRISSYLGKQTNLEPIALDPFNSDLSPQKK
jgi:hypothetical protein